MVTLIKKYEKYPHIDIVKYRVYKGIYIRGNRQKTNITEVREDGEYYVNVLTGEARKKTHQELFESIRVSQSRAYHNLKRVIESNIWSYFVTLTFNSDTQDRYLDSEVLKRYKTFIQWLNKYVPKAYYVTAVDWHKDGAVHYHMLLGGATREELKLITPKLLIKQLKAERKKSKKGKANDVDYVKDWYMRTYPEYDDNGRVNYCFRHFCKYGRNTVTEIEDSGKSGTYLLKKYLAKSLSLGEVTGRKSYYVSRNCHRPKIDTMEIVYDETLEVGEILQRDMQDHGLDYKIENVKYMYPDKGIAAYTLCKGEYKLNNAEICNSWETFDREYTLQETKRLLDWLKSNIPKDVSKQLQIDYRALELAELETLKSQCEAVIEKRCSAVQSILQSGIQPIIGRFAAYSNLDDVSTIELCSMAAEARNYQTRF